MAREQLDSEEISAEPVNVWIFIFYSNFNHLTILSGDHSIEKYLYTSEYFEVINLYLILSHFYYQ